MKKIFLLASCILIVGCNANHEDRIKALELRMKIMFDMAEENRANVAHTENIISELRSRIETVEERGLNKPATAPVDKIGSSKP